MKSNRCILLIPALFICVQALTVTNLRQYQVIARTTEQSADYVVSGTCESGIFDVQFQMTAQGSSTPLNGFAWKSTQAAVSGTTWTATLKGLPVGGEYAISFRGTDQTGTVTDPGPTVDGILVGDLWIASGQSNLGGHSKATAVAHVHGYNNYTNSWFRTSHNLSVAFGTTIYRNSGVPIGISTLVCSGCEISLWGDGKIFLEAIYQEIKHFQGNIKGFIWYQGESDSEDFHDRARTFLYRQRLGELIGKVRAHVQKPDLACLVVQIGSLYPAGAIVVRGAHFDVSKDDPTIATIPVYDLGADLHLSETRLDTAGQRLGNACLRAIFGMQNHYFGPQFRDAFFSDAERKKITVRFSHVKGALTGFTNDPERLGFFVMDTAVWRRNDSTLSIGYTTPGLLLPIDTVTRIAPDQLSIQLKSPATAPVTISYGRHSNMFMMKMDFVTDESGIPMPTTFNYPVLPAEPASGIGELTIYNRPPTPARATPRLVYVNPGAVTGSLPGLFSISGRSIPGSYARDPIRLRAGVFCRQVE